MANKSDIEWTDATWSPVTGCTKVDDTCKYCYAEREVETRWSKNPKSVWFGRAFTDVQCHQDKLDQPLRWRKGLKIFVCPRADLFHEDVDDTFLDCVFAVMALAPQHTFQVLTKRAKRMRAYISAGGRAADVFAYMRHSELGYWAGSDKLPQRSWPLSNVWLGVSAGDQKKFDERVEHLAATPAEIRFVSLEPLLEEIDCGNAFDYPPDGSPYGKIDWVISGGESGPKARPSKLDWFRSLRDECAAAGVAYFHKQNGEWVECETEVLSEPPGRVVYPIDDSIELNPNRSFTVMQAHGTEFVRVGKRAAGRLLDGREHSEFPA